MLRCPRCGCDLGLVWFLLSSLTQPGDGGECGGGHDAGHDQEYGLRGVSEVEAHEPGNGRHGRAAALGLGDPGGLRCGLPAWHAPGGRPTVAAIPRFVRLDFAHASQTVFLVMAAAALIACTGLRQGRQQEVGEARVVPESGAPQQEIPSRP